MACTAALASLDLLLKKQTLENIERICSEHQQFLNEIKDHLAIKSIRQRGTILALELK
ncbi:hypothetical protein QW060_25325 [Myroides ceti]|uniref:Uncharacterized protein n=1 Tax=Paenimyroides ceti TaxID=395087 RepID=A0ABT8D074_9FLAO|nr:hypothetical protein [Paenimyroides ceti]MDN3710194.1 hypothetical protein [Paenimyroides ceti]